MMNMKQKIIFGTILVLLSLFLVNISFAQKEPIIIGEGKEGEIPEYTGMCSTDYDCSGMPQKSVRLDDQEFKCSPLCIEGRCECKPLAGDWHGDIYATESWPPPENINKILDNYKIQVIALGISESYFDEHFDLVSVRDSSPSFVFKIGEYSASFLYGLNTESLHEITTVISRIDAENILKNCLGDFYTARESIEKNGDLVLKALSKDEKYIASVNLETGECEKSEVTYTTLGEAENLGLRPPQKQIDNIWIYIGVGVIIFSIIIFLLIKKLKK